MYPNQRTQRKQQQQRNKFLRYEPLQGSNLNGSVLRLATAKCPVGHVLIGAFPTFLILLFLVTNLRGALAQPPADPFAEEVVAIKAQRIETVGRGVVQNGTVIIRNGKITAVGTDVKIPLGAKIVQAQTVMPGIVGVYSQIGISPTGALPNTVPAVSNPHFRVMDELYPFDDNYTRLLRAGVTTLALVPGGKGINGQGAIVRPYGDTAEKMALMPNAPLAVNFVANTQAMTLIRTTFEAARPAPPPAANPMPATPMPGTPPKPSEEEDAGSDMQRGQRRQRPMGAVPPPVTAAAPPDVRREPILRAVQGTIPTFITCADAASTLYALPLFQPFDTLKPVYILNPDCYHIAETLGQKKVSAVLGAYLTFEPLTRNRLNVPAILARAGAKIACRPLADTPDGYEALRFNMGELVKTGMDRDLALRAITLSPAEMLAIDSRVGSIEVGKDGNLILLDGDPFAATTRVRGVLLEGKRLYDGE